MSSLRLSLIPPENNTLQRAVVLCMVLGLGLLASCSSQPPKAPALAQAYVGPATLNLRKELAPSSPTVGTAKHGDKVDVIQTRRRFIRVRTADGIEGWTDNRQLLSANQMGSIRDMAERAAKLPSRGRATAVTTLNVHAEPSRVSPTIYQLQEKASVEVVARKLLPRTAQPTNPPLVIARPKPPAREKKAKEAAKGGRVQPPPMPAAPKPPSDWLELSRAVEPEDIEPANEPSTPQKPVSMDDWSLIVTKDGKAGWVLGRMLTMAIPDEVAQYAEGARITSYYSLGKASDEGQVKDHWLWTTLSKPNAQYDFDAFRVFIWSVRHHRYETAYVERGVEGVLPASVHQIDVPNGKTTAKAQGFAVLVREDDGRLYRKTFWFEPYKVRQMDKVAVPPLPDPMDLTAPQPSIGVPEPEKPKAESWWTRTKSRFKGMLAR